MGKYNIIINDLKDMLTKTKDMFAERPAYKIKTAPGEYKVITHGEAHEMIDALGTALIKLGLKGKRIAVIGENRYEWGIAYMATVCGTGTIVPLDKALPENELEDLIGRSEVEAICYSAKYEEMVLNIKNKDTNNLKYLITMDSSNNADVYSQKELIEKGKKLIAEGNREFLDATINPDEMNIMLFTSGTTSTSKVVALSHKNICSNLMDIQAVLDINEEDRVLSFLPMHHVFECTTGLLYSLLVGSQVSYCDGIRFIMENLNEYKITFACFVPAIYENIYKNIVKNLEKAGKLEVIRMLEEKYKDATLAEKKAVFKDIHNIFGGEVRLFVSGAAALDKEVAQGFRNWGFNLCQGYGLTETSPVVAVETETEARAGSIGKTLPQVEVKLDNVNDEGIGELLVKGPNVMLGYYGNDEATNEAIKGEWFYTGDLAKIDEDGFIYICGRKKSVIVLKNGKNIFPEEMETLINKIDGVKESFVFGKQKSDDIEDIKINAKIIFDRTIMEEKYNARTDEEIQKSLFNKIKEINDIMPNYKAIRAIIISEKPLIKTTTNKIKRQENLKNI